MRPLWDIFVSLIFAGGGGLSKKFLAFSLVCFGLLHKVHYILSLFSLLVACVSG